MLPPRREGAFAPAARRRLRRPRPDTRPSPSGPWTRDGSLLAPPRHGRTRTSIRAASAAACHEREVTTRRRLRVEWRLPSHASMWARAVHDLIALLLE